MLESLLYFGKMLPTSNSPSMFCGAKMIYKFALSSVFNENYMQVERDHSQSINHCLRKTGLKCLERHPQCVNNSQHNLYQYISSSSQFKLLSTISPSKKESTSRFKCQKIAFWQNSSPFKQTGVYLGLQFIKAK